MQQAMINPTRCFGWEDTRNGKPELKISMEKYFFEKSVDNESKKKFRIYET
jgi:hypothetical protein